MKRYCTISEASRMLNVSEDEIHILIEIGELSCIENGNQILLFVSEIEDINYIRQYEPWNAKYNKKYD